MLVVSDISNLTILSTNEPQSISLRRDPVSNHALLQSRYETSLKQEGQVLGMPIKDLPLNLNLIRDWIRRL
jgi:hypothetical protein